jgi:hypothetical protein
MSCLNEQKASGKRLARGLAVLKGFDASGEIAVAYNGSTD